MEEGSETDNPLKNITESFKKLFETVADEETRTFVSNMISEENHNERFKTFVNYLDKNCSDDQSRNFIKMMSQRPDENEVKNVYEKLRKTKSLDELVLEKKNINSRIANLSEDEQVEFWSKYHNIPTDKDINNKLDTISESIQILNRNFNEFSNEIYTEISILRKQLSK